MQKTWRSHLLLAYSLAILAFLYVPLVILAMYSFNDSRINAVWTGFTFRWYEQLFNNRRVLEALINTLIIGFASTIVSTTLGTIAAIALHRYKYKMQSVINGLVYLPILIPEIVMGLSLLVLFSQVQMPLGKGSLILAHPDPGPYHLLPVFRGDHGRRAAGRHAQRLRAGSQRSVRHPLAMLPLHHPAPHHAGHRGRSPYRLHSFHR